MHSCRRSEGNQAGHGKAALLSLHMQRLVGPPENATMFMSFRTAPMDSVTLPSVKDGTSSHILCRKATHDLMQQGECSNNTMVSTE